MKNRLNTVWRRFRLLLHNADRLLISIFTISAIFAMITATVVLVAFTETQISISLGNPSILKSVTDAVLDLLGVNYNGLSTDKYLSLLSSATGSVAVLVTLWFSVVTTVKYYNHRLEVERRSLVQMIPVYEDGKEDLDVMLKFYRKAEHVTVYSGDFSWISLNKDLKNEIIRLVSEKKISLVSYKSEAIVKQAIQDDNLYEKLRIMFSFDSHVDKKCSLVQSGSRKMFLYKVDRELEGGNKSVCILFGKGEGEYLVESISSLSKPFFTV